MLIVCLWSLAHIVLHELGHIIAGLIIGCRPVKLVFQNFGPAVLISPPKTEMGPAIIAVGGPLINIITGILLMGLHMPDGWLAFYYALMSLLPYKRSDSYIIWHCIKNCMIKK